MSKEFTSDDPVPAPEEVETATVALDLPVVLLLAADKIAADHTIRDKREVTRDEVIAKLLSLALISLGDHIIKIEAH